MSGSTIVNKQLSYTATFTQPISGVRASDFRLDVQDTGSQLTYSQGVEAIGAEPAARWVLTVNITGGLYTTATPVNFVAQAFEAGIAHVSPTNVAGDSSFTLVYSPPIVAITATEGGSTVANGGVATRPDFKFTATYSPGVTGMALSDWNADMSTLGLSGAACTSEAVGGIPSLIEGTYGWIAVDNTHTSVNENSNRDDNVYTIDINGAAGWSFPWFGTDYGSVRLSVNGYVTFDVATSNWGYTPSTSLPADGCAVWWADHYVRPSDIANANIYSKVTATEAVITWVEVNQYASGYNDANKVSFQLIMYPDGTIKMQYQDVITSNRYSSGANSAVGCRTPMGASVIPDSSTAGAKLTDGTALVLSSAVPTHFELSCTVQDTLGAHGDTPAVGVNINEFTGAVIAPNSPSGAFGFTYDPPTPVISSAERANTATVVFTITFDSDVSLNGGYNLANLDTDFNLNTGSLTTGTSTLTANSATEYLYTVTVTGGLAVSQTISLGPIAENVGAWSELTQVSNAAVSVTLEAATVSWSGSASDNGVSAFSRIAFTATFAPDVTGVVEADFGLVTSGGSVTTDFVGVSTDTEKDWVLEVIAVDPSVAFTATVAIIPEIQGNIVPINMASTADYTITYEPPKTQWRASPTGATSTTTDSTVLVFKLGSNAELNGLTTDSFQCTVNKNGAASSFAGISATTAVSATGNAPSSEWVLTVTITPQGDLTSAHVSCTLDDSMPDGIPSTTFDTGAGTSATYELTYQRPPNPTPTYSSAQTFTGGDLLGNVFMLTATFTEAVDGVTTEAFNCASSDTASTWDYSVAKVDTTAKSVQWILTATLSAGLTAQNLTCSPFEAGVATGTTNTNAAGSNSYTVNVVPTTPTLSCSTPTAGADIVITATFDMDTWNVTEADLNLSDDTAITYGTTFVAMDPQSESPPRDNILAEVPFAAMGGWKDPVSASHTRVTGTGRGQHFHTTYDVNAASGWSFPMSEDITADLMYFSSHGYVYYGSWPNWGLICAWCSYWQVDTDVDATSGVYVYSDSDSMVFTWLKMYTSYGFSTDNDVSFQIEMFRDGSFISRYLDVVSIGPQAYGANSWAPLYLNYATNGWTYITPNTELTFGSNWWESYRPSKLTNDIAYALQAAAPRAYTLTITPTGGLATTTFSSVINELSGGILPLNMAASQHDCVFDPPTPVFTCTTANSNVFAITATFDSAISGLNATHFNLTNTGTLDFSTSLALVPPGRRRLSSVATGSGTVWALTVTVTDAGDIMDTDFMVDMGEMLSGVSPPNEVATQKMCEYRPPTPTITSAFDGTTTPAVENVMLFTATFSSSMTGLVAGDFSYTGLAAGGTSAVASLSGTVAEITLTVPATAIVDADIVIDMGQHAGSIVPFNAAAPSSHTINYRPPHPVFTSCAICDTDPFTITATFSSAVSGVAASDFVLVTNDVTIGTTTVAPASGSAPDTVWVLTVPVTTVTGNNNNLSVDMAMSSGSITPLNRVAAQHTFQFLPPTPTFSSSVGVSGSSTFNNVIPITATFTTAVSGLTAADFNIDTGSMAHTSSLVATGGEPAIEWILTVTINGGTGIVSDVDVAMDILDDISTVTPLNNAATNGAAAASSFVIAYRPPVPTFTSSSGGTTDAAQERNDVFRFTATYSQPVSGVVASDFGVSAGSLTVAESVAGSGTAWVLTLSMSTPNIVPQVVTVTTLDASGAIVPLNEEGSNNGFSVSYDPPLPVLSSAMTAGTRRLAAHGDVINVDTLYFTATFDAAVSGVAVSDFNLDKGNLDVIKAVTPSSGTHTVFVLSVHVKGRGITDQTITVSMDEGSGVISPKNEAAASSFALEYRPPTPTFTSQHGTSGTEVNEPVFYFTATYSTAVTGVTVDDFKLMASDSGLTRYTTELNQASSANAIKWVLKVTVLGPPSDVDFNVTTVSDSGSLSPNNAPATNNGFSILYRPPTPTFTSSNADHMGTTPSNVIKVTATYTSAVTGVKASDFNLMLRYPGLSTVSVVVEPAPSATVSVWVMTVTMDAPTISNNTLTVWTGQRSGMITPMNANSTSPYTALYRPPEPTFSCSLGPSGTVTHRPLIVFTASFTSPVSGVTLADFNLDDDQLPSTNVAVTSQSGNSEDYVWFLTFNVFANFQDAVVTVHMNEASNNILPVNMKATNNKFVISYEPPTPILSSSLGPNSLINTNLHQFTVTATFDSPVTDVTDNDFIVQPGILSVSKSSTSQGGTNTDTVWILTLTITGNTNPATITVTIAERSGNIDPPNAALGASVFAAVYEPPACVITNGGVSSTQYPELRFTATFDVAVTGFTASDVLVSSGSVTTSTTVSTIVRRRLLADRPHRGHTGRVLATQSNSWLIVVALTGNLQPQEVSIRVPENMVSPRNQASILYGNPGGEQAMIVYDPPVVEGETEQDDGTRAVFTAAAIETTALQQIPFVLDFAFPVSGVDTSNIVLTGVGASGVTYTVSPVGGSEPARYWNVVATVSASTPAGMLNVYTNNDNNNIQPPPSANSNPVYQVNYDPSSNVDSTIGWLLILLICSVIVCCLTIVCLLVVQKVCHKGPRGTKPPSFRSQVAPAAQPQTLAQPVPQHAVNMYAQPGYGAQAGYGMQPGLQYGQQK